MIFIEKLQIFEKNIHFILLCLFFLLLLLMKPQTAVGTTRASPWYEQSCYCFNTFTYLISL